MMMMMVFLLGCKTFQATGQSVKPAVFALNSSALQQNKTRIVNKDADILEAYKQLIKDADQKALTFGPVSVMEKKALPPSGNKHDYMSLAPYHWPDPAKPDGLPYIRKDGQTNPEVREYPDKENMPRLCEAVYTLGLAYYFSEENQYAEHAAKLLRVWFLDTATRMNPNLNFGQMIKGVNEGRGAGMIDTRHWIKLIDGIGLIKSSKHWNKEDQKGMQQWFAQFLNWMQASKNGVEELNAKNNHGAWYDAQRLSIALFIDSQYLAKQVVLNAANRLDYQADENGFFPLELARTTSFHYSCFVVDAFFMIANMSQKTDIDFWNLTTPSGKSLKKCFEALKPFLLKEQEWKGEQIKEFNYEEGYDILMNAAAHLTCRNCRQGVKQLAGEKTSRLRLNLLY